jgi:hypothetical protein
MLIRHFANVKSATHILVCEYFFIEPVAQPTNFEKKRVVISDMDISHVGPRSGRAAIGNRHALDHEDYPIGPQGWA